MNGRLLDTLTIDWTTGIAKEAAIKLNRRISFDEGGSWRLSDKPPILNMTSEDIDMNVTSMDPFFVREVYQHGNINVVMCPATNYWQEKISNICEKVVN